MGFLLSLICNAVMSVLFLGWAKRETDAQIGKMQDAAFDTPGAQSPLPPPVLVSGVALAAGQMGLAKGVWRLSSSQAVISVLLGGAIAAVLRLFQPRNNP